MVLRLLKTQKENQLFIERIMYTKRYTLILDKERCVGCEICSIACPREAITVTKPVKINGEKLKLPTITIDETKCSFCGICNAICPLGALSLTINGKAFEPVVEKESFPCLVRDIKVEEVKCPVDCNECEKACPFNLIKVTTNKTNGSVKVEIDEKHCPGCRLCEIKCPQGAITVKKIISGLITIDTNKCPTGCCECFVVCPVPGVLNLLNNGFVSVDEYCCIYCGVCKVVCPSEDALRLERTAFSHTSVRSGAWNKALEKLSSTQGMVKELRSKSALKVKDSVKRRIG
jgi:4Fe-4S ferredoxin